ncbi:hypothetical protein XA68_16890 [Ophiocordyceps unilateralis]|uniref:Uncharacterized protein n=1 Tax=Ophiocordyceps unilateralis TaxID=268505 RepID=A0A2A9P5R0_OPHUN|nr:hypothetical protein XA68_16890 [Ophiocordyceps unilateralis]
MVIQTTQQELKNDHNPVDRKPSDEENLLQQDYLQCMRRLQANLSYMATLADRKPEVKVPPCPAYLSAPPLNLALPVRTPDGVDLGDLDPAADRVEREQIIRELYGRLQAAFPGFDPKKEPSFGRTAAPGQKAGNQVSPTVQQAPQMLGMPPHLGGV